MGDILVGTHIHEIYGRFCGDEEELIEHFYFFRGPFNDCDSFGSFELSLGFDQSVVKEFDLGIPGIALMFFGCVCKFVLYKV